MSNFGDFSVTRRKGVRVTQERLVTTDHVTPTQTLPLLVRPRLGGVNLAAWARNNRELLEVWLHEHGAVLFRGFGVGDVVGFEGLARAVSHDLLDYRERAAPRVEVGRNVYTSTEYPADQPIPLHHEMSYSHNWPTKIWFHCVKTATSGGATPIADDRKVYKRIDPKIKELFIRKNIMYVRNYGEGVDLTWQEAFQTTDRTKVEEYCRQARTLFEWKDGNRLQTRQVRQAVATHPKLRETVWFNHAHMFHVSNLEPAVREALLAEFATDELPRNAFYGDGSPIEDSVLDEIRNVYKEAAVTFAWQEGDTLMLDNFLTSHGREPFTGPRRIVVAMAELYVNEEVY